MSGSGVLEDSFVFERLCRGLSWFGVSASGFSGAGLH